MATDTDLNRIAGEIRHALEDRKRAVAAEMRAYPQPIAGCDAQYQHLSDVRAAIARELGALDGARDARSIEAFLDRATLLDADVRARLREALDKAPA